MPDLQNLNMSSRFAGLKQYDSKTSSSAVASQNLGAGAYLRNLQSIPMLNNDSVSLVMIRYTGIEPVWRPVLGRIVVNIPVYNVPQIQLETFIYFQNSNLYIDTYIVNQTGGTITVPAFSVDVNASLFQAPFN